MVLTAAVVAWGLLYVILPIFSAFVDVELFLTPDKNPQALLFFGTLIMGTSVLSGLYPAFVLSAFQPTRVLKSGDSGGKGRAFLRRRLVEFQFGVSVVLIAVTLIVYNQFDYAQNKKLGFEKEQIFYYRTGYPGVEEKAEVIKDALDLEAGVVATARFGQIPFSRYFHHRDGIGTEGSDQKVDLSIFVIDGDFIDLFAMRLVAGRNVRKGVSDEVIINETAAGAFGFADPSQAIGRQIAINTGKESIVGVVEDFHFESIRQRIGPVALYGIGNGNYSFTGVKVRPENMRQTMVHLEDIWKRFAPDYPFTYYFIDADFEKLYRAEERLAYILGLFSVLAVAIACLGVFTLGVYTAERRSKEIGVRKVLGASVRNIVILLSGEFTRLILTANLVAWPIIYMASERWLAHFAYKQAPGVLVYLTSGIAILLIAWLTVGGQAIRVARRNPVQSLRQE